MKNIILFTFIFFISFIFSCEIVSNTSLTPPTQSKLANTSWQLSFIRGYSAHKEEYQKFSIYFYDNKLNIKAFNTFNSKVEVLNNKITTSNMFGTRMLPPLIKLENDFIKYIKEAKTYKISNKKLYLGESNILIFNLNK